MIDGARLARELEAMAQRVRECRTISDLHHAIGPYCPVQTMPKRDGRMYLDVTISLELEPVEQT